MLDAIASVPRELFVPSYLQDQAYNDTALPIDCEQTISQPYIVARMTELILHDKNNHKVLEIGTGSGYQAAVLSQLFDEVYTVERIKTLLDQASSCFKKLKLKNIHSLHDNGYKGWPAHGPFNSIIVTAASRQIPQILLNQLADKGRMVIPVGEREQQSLQLVTRNGEHFEKITYDAVLFVPMLSGIQD